MEVSNITYTPDPELKLLTPTFKEGRPSNINVISLSISETDTDTGLKFKSNMDNVDPNGKAKETEYDLKGYALRGKIMLIAIVILFIVIIIMLCLHVYARRYLERARRQQQLRRNRRRRLPHLVFYVDPSAGTVASRGLDASVITSLPVFAFSPNTHPDPVECAVCLSEFQDGETGRVLPKCNHSFHIDCIDMWFQSHSTCPLCRALVEPPPAGETRPDVVVTVYGPEPGSSSGLCQHGEEELYRTGPAVSSSSSSIGKPPSLVGVTVEVPGRSESFGDESGCDSPSTQSSFRSPISRMLSFKRILSRERKASVSLSSGCVVGCSSMGELDAERGVREEIQ